MSDWQAWAESELDRQIDDYVNRDVDIPDCLAEEMADREADNYCRTFLGWSEIEDVI